MQYVSTRGQAPVLGFSGVLLAGLAEDGGLYMPSSWPEFSAAEFSRLRGLPYAELAARVIHPFVGDDLSFDTLQTLCRAAYKNFGHPAVAPMLQLGPQRGIHRRESVGPARQAAFQLGDGIGHGAIGNCDGGQGRAG